MALGLQPGGDPLEPVERQRREQHDPSQEFENVLASDRPIVETSEAAASEDDHDRGQPPGDEQGSAGAARDQQRRPHETAEPLE